MARDFEAQPVSLNDSHPRAAKPPISLMDVAVTLIVVGILLGFSVVALGCASPGGQYTNHSPAALRQEGPSSKDASIYMQDGTETTPASSSLQGGYGPSRVTADRSGVSSASTISQNVATLWLPFDSNGDGAITDAETNILNFAGSSDLSANGVRITRTTFFKPDGSTDRTESKVELDGFSSNNSPVATATLPIIAEIAKAYTAASADRRAEYDKYMETAQVAIQQGRLALADALSAGLKILTGGATAVIPSP